MISVKMFEVRVIILLLLSFLIIVATVQIGDNCTDENSGLPGKCIDQNGVCPYAIKRHKIPGNCNFVTKNSPLICCPSTSLRKSEEKCIDYYAKPSVRVSRLAKSNLREFPHMSAVGFGKKDNIIWACGGSLISEQFVLTAAQCTRSTEIYGPPKWIRIGELDLNSSTEGANPIDLSIIKTYVHPNYQFDNAYNDIALLKLEKEIVFGDNYKPACLHTQKNIPNKLQATGWGAIHYIGDRISHLKKINLRPVDNKQCSPHYISIKKLPYGILDESQICVVGDIPGDGTCHGDGGGPLHFKREEFLNMREHFVIVGITSVGKGCGENNVPEVHTRISAYIDWIESIVWDFEQHNDISKVDISLEDILVFPDQNLPLFRKIKFKN